MENEITNLAKRLGRADLIIEIQRWFDRSQFYEPKMFKEEFYTFLKQLTSDK